ncbi:hypothetical protein IF188_18020 [Microbacterium sp. NEAU-LLC]|uniref:Uncharacterized protein n=1 Tax=Microbacterium helvum TaxID=2773713 RepID=A0ABR8NT21_9MICO|nr:hypothetical protein [Microbacterium helvum]MBD3943592.1 hypothetical protein [Microbacterium helvum]
MNERFVLQQLTPVEWIIVDASCAVDDPHRTVTCIREISSAEYEAVWLRHLALPVIYASPRAVLDDVIRVAAHPSRVPSRKPVPIPHLAPPTRVAH